jgi:hypothetical protein
LYQLKLVNIFLYKEGGDQYCIAASGFYQDGSPDTVQVRRFLYVMPLSHFQNVSRHKRNQVQGGSPAWRSDKMSRFEIGCVI